MSGASEKKPVRIMDGGMGRELERRGASFRQPEWSALAMMDAPEIVQEVHSAFIDSGAEVIITNSYALVPFHIGQERFEAKAESLAQRAGQVARAAADQAATEVQVAGAIPPLFGSYRPDLYQPDQAEAVVTPLIRGQLPYVDCWILETQTLIAETREVCRVLKALDGETKPIWIAFSLKDEHVTDIPQLRSGESVETAVRALVTDDVTAILFNCCQPEVIEAALAITREVLEQLGRVNIELGAYANAFAPQAEDAAANDNLNEIRDDLGPDAYLKWAERWHQRGATLIGGCCGIGPEHITALQQHFSIES